MKLEPRSTLIFTATFLVLLGGLAWAYPVLLSGYLRVVLACANPLLAQLAHPIEGAVGPDGDLVAFILGPGGQRHRLYEGTYHPYVIFVSLILFPALVVATPVPWRRRLRFLGIGMAVLFVLHVASIFGLFQTHQCLSARPEAPSCRWIQAWVMTSGQLGAAALWLYFAWMEWIRA